MSTFADAWDYADKIKGWYSWQEARLLWDCALMVPGTAFCEVGSYRGRSTSLLAHTGAEIHVIEPFILEPGSPNDTPASGGRYVTEQYCPVIVADFMKNLAPFAVQIHIHVGKAEDKHSVIPEVGLLHVDGDHMDGVFQDVELLTPKLISGGIAVFHDYLPIHTNFTRVKEAVDALGWEIVGRADSAIAIRKP